MKLESPKVKTGKDQKEMFTFLTNVENYEQLMPESKEKFEPISQDSFLFQLKGMPEIRLKIKETKEPELIVLGSTSDKFPFNLNLNILALDGSSSEVYLDFEGNFNPMMSMMIKGPLKKFINTLSENIAKQ